MTFIRVDNTGINNRFYSVTGASSLTLKNLYVYKHLSDKTMRYLPAPHADTVFIARVNRDFIDSHRDATPLIPIDTYPKLTALQQPAVSSLEDYQTPAL
mgnify:FL=1